MEKHTEPKPNAPKKAPKKGLDVYELVLFPILGALMFVSKLLMEALPNVHLLGLFLVTFTVVFRRKALWPLGVYLALDGLVYGFSPLWLPYLYVWPILWGMTMLLPRNLPRKWQCVLYPAVCALHGFLFGTLYAPGWALATHMPLKAMGAWIVKGLPYDAVHGVSNLIAGLLIVPLCDLIRRLIQNRGKNE